MRIGPKATDMSCSHQLNFVPDGHKCGRLHGHSYKVRAWVSCDARCFDPAECRSEGLDEPVQWVMDYGELLEACKTEIKDVLCHRHLNDTLEHPTTENLCRWVWPRIERRLPAHVRLDSIEIHEGEHVCRLDRI
jgi:6-pyruvoyltetrahydropterin/6-carboxytetrahydropterin synthase